MVAEVKHSRTCAITDFLWSCSPHPPKKGGAAYIIAGIIKQFVILTLYLQV